VDEESRRAKSARLGLARRLDLTPSRRNFANLSARHTSPIQEKDRRALQRYPGAATTDWSLDTGLDFDTFSSFVTFGYVW